LHGCGGGGGGGCGSGGGDGGTVNGGKQIVLFSGMMKINLRGPNWNCIVMKLVISLG
jgi:hypothetical protein